MTDKILYGKVGRRTPTIIEQAGGEFKSLWICEDKMLVMFEDASQPHPRSSLTVDYREMHKSSDPVGFVRRHIEESRKKFKEAPHAG